jgi:hypothetical protein
MHAVVELFRGVDGLASSDAQSRLTALAPTLSLSGSLNPSRPDGRIASADPACSPWLGSEGFVALSEAAPLETCAHMVEGIERLVAAGLPAMFVYLFDEPWTLGLGLVARISAMLERPYELLDDTWAWRIEPGKGRGWPPHRGIAAPVLDRSAPELINVWVALSEAGAERSCMHFVPLDDDPSYPKDLANVGAPLEVVRAAPLAAGSALAWNANILHWGGPCSARAAGPRISCSFSLGRADVREGMGFRSGVPAATDLRARLDSVALQLDVYGAGQPDVSAEVLEWARAARALERQISLLSRAPDPAS